MSHWRSLELHDSTKSSHFGLQELNNDIIYEITSRLDGCNRHALSGCCRRLHSLMHSTFDEVTVSIPLKIFRALDAQSNTLANIRKLNILLPAKNNCKVPGHPCLLQPVEALTSFLDVYLNQDQPFLKLESLSLQQDDCMTSIVTYDTVAHIAFIAQSLRSLSLPMLSPAAACALPLLPTTLTSLSLVVSDSPSLDLALQLPCLQHLSVSTREGLYYLLLSLGQISHISGLSALASLKLSQVFISDCRLTFDPLSVLTSLTELCVSSPLSAERLNQLPSSLKVLQLPCFAGGLEAAAGLGPTFNLTELRCRQALTEIDLSSLFHMRNLARLSCDKIILSDSKVQAVQVLLMNQPLIQAMDLDTEPVTLLLPSVPLPMLPQVKSLSFSGYHKHNGLLGLMFPGLETLKIASLEVPHPCPLHVAPLPCLKHLVLPSCKVLPALLAACPALASLSISGINCLQRLEELLNLAPPCWSTPPQSTFVVQSELAAKGPWWPSQLKTLSLGFSSSLRFRPKQIAASLSVMPDTMGNCVRLLELRDRGRDASGLEPAGRVVDDSVLASAVAAMQGIEELCLVQCGAVSGGGLRQVIQQLAGSRLVSLVVIGCPKVSRAEAEGIPYMLGKPFMEARWYQNFASWVHEPFCSSSRGVSNQRAWPSVS